MSSAHLIDTNKLKAEALRLGFSAVGFNQASFVEEAVQLSYRSWLAEGHQGEMHYLENHLDMRFNPTLLVPEARTVISLLASYHPAGNPTQPALAWYAQGQDYHDVLRRKMQQLMQQFQLTGRCFTDSAPVLERYWAWHSGLGFIGKNGQLVVPGQGSAFFIAEMIVQQEADHHDRPLTPTYFDNLCGNCHRCIDACPMQALQANGSMQATRCLSYLTIEQRGAIPNEAKAHLNPCFYGCDRCLQACPHLHAPQQPTMPEFLASKELVAMKPDDWKHLTEENFRQLFKGSAVKRAKYAGLMRNIEAHNE